MNSVRFGDKYILLDQIGAGGVAEVFRGKLTREQGFEKLIVIKKLLPEHATDREMVDIFISEARLAALLQHDNIAATYDFGELDGEYFLAMEYLSGKNLHAVMARARDHRDLLTPTHALAICARICEGMEYAHNLSDMQNKPLNLVHRDLTPHNIFITYDGKVKIIDFGVAKAELFDNKTREGVVKGKISYMSPERLSGEDVDSRADIFSIGILLYEMIARARMYQGDTAELIRKCLTADFEKLNTVAPGLDPRLYAIVDKALAVDVAQRYQTCAEMQGDIDDLLFTMQERPDSKFLKDSIRQLFGREYEDERRKIALLFSDYHETELPKRDRTGISIPARADREAASDKTAALAYRPLVQLIRSKTAALRGWIRRGGETIGSLSGDYPIDRRYLWAGGGVAAGVALLVAVLQSGNESPSGPMSLDEPPAATIAAVPAGAADRDEVPQDEAVPVAAAQERTEDAAVGPPAGEVSILPDEAPLTPDAPVRERSTPVRPAVAGGAKVPVLKTREMKIRKQTSLPLPQGDTVAVSGGARPVQPRMDPFPEAPPVDVSGQTLSFEEEAETTARRRTILMLHTRADEAMQQQRLLEPVEQSAYAYYQRILELDPNDSRATHGLLLIGDACAADAETALAAKQFDRAAESVTGGLKAMPDDPRLIALHGRIERERADRIHELSEKARLCLDANKLSSPADDSAYYYYTEILRLDPENGPARKGYAVIADRYAHLADQSFQEFDFDQAEIYVRRGLQVVPNHYYLLSLEEKLQRSDLEKVGHSVKERINRLFSN